jgi:hypothetical protein
VSRSTVKHHISTIFKKLGVDNRLQAALHVVEDGLVDSRCGRRLGQVSTTECPAELLLAERRGPQTREDRAGEDDDVLGATIRRPGVGVSLLGLSVDPAGLPWRSLGVSARLRLVPARTEARDRRRTEVWLRVVRLQRSRPTRRSAA